MSKHTRMEVIIFPEGSLLMAGSNLSLPELKLVAQDREVAANERQ